MMKQRKDGHKANCPLAADQMFSSRTVEHFSIEEAVET